jgi:hypothetical protein
MRVVLIGLHRIDRGVHGGLSLDSLSNPVGTHDGDLCCRESALSCEEGYVWIRSPRVVVVVVGYSI